MQRVVCLPTRPAACPALSCRRRDWTDTRSRAHVGEPRHVVEDTVWSVSRLVIISGRVAFLAPESESTHQRPSMTIRMRSAVAPAPPRSKVLFFGLSAAPRTPRSLAAGSCCALRRGLLQRLLLPLGARGADWAWRSRFAIAPAIAALQTPQRPNAKMTPRPTYLMLVNLTDQGVRGVKEIRTGRTRATARNSASSARPPDDLGPKDFVRP